MKKIRKIATLLAVLTPFFLSLSVSAKELRCRDGNWLQRKSQSYLDEMNYSVQDISKYRLAYDDLRDNDIQNLVNLQFPRLVSLRLNLSRYREVPKMWNQIYYACDRRDQEEFAKSSKKQAEDNIVIVEEWLNQMELAYHTFMKTAAQRGIVGILKDAIYYKLDYNAVNMDGQTPFEIAVKGNKIEFVKMILEAGVSDDTLVKPIFPHGLPLIYDVIDNSKVELFKLLISNLDEVEETRLPYLHFERNIRDVNMVDLALMRFEVLYPTSDARDNAFDILMLLLEKGYSPDSTKEFFTEVIKANTLNTEEKGSGINDYVDVKSNFRYKNVPLKKEKEVYFRTGLSGSYKIVEISNIKDSSLNSIPATEVEFECTSMSWPKDKSINVPTIKKGSIKKFEENGKKITACVYPVEGRVRALRFKLKVNKDIFFDLVQHNYASDLPRRYRD